MTTATQISELESTAQFAAAAQLTERDAAFAYYALYDLSHRIHSAHSPSDFRNRLASVQKRIGFDGESLAESERLDAERNEAFRGKVELLIGLIRESPDDCERLAALGDRIDASESRGGKSRTRLNRYKQHMQAVRLSLSISIPAGLSIGFASHVAQRIREDKC